MNNLESAYKIISEGLCFRGETNLGDSLFINLIKCAFVRSLEFNLQIALNQNSNSYFYLPFLRGLTEDIIVLNYLETVIEDNDKNDFIGYLMIKDVIESTTKQNEFFNKKRSVQPIVTNKILDEIYPENIFEVKLSNFKAKYSWKRRFPSVFQMAEDSNLKMAEDSNLKEIYSYFYHSTSRLVHFNPHLLMKMSWGECNSLGAYHLSNGLYKISTSNFSDYYRFFCEFYGSFLFVEFIKLFDYYLMMTRDFNDEIEVIKEMFTDNRRWPELVTFEELNIDLKVGISKYDLEKGGLEQLIGRMMHRLFQNENNT